MIMPSQNSSQRFQNKFIKQQMLLHRAECSTNRFFNNQAVNYAIMNNNTTKRKWKIRTVMTSDPTFKIIVYISMMNMTSVWLVKTTVCESEKNDSTGLHRSPRRRRRYGNREIIRILLRWYQLPAWLQTLFTEWMINLIWNRQWKWKYRSCLSADRGMQKMSSENIIKIKYIYLASAKQIKIIQLKCIKL